jgi:RNA polymerase sigma-54 factor
MSLELKQSMKMSQQLVMTPQLQQAIKLLQLSRMELVDLIREEMEQNPLLEEPADTIQEAQDEKAPGEASLEADSVPAPEAPESAKTEEVKGEEGKNSDIDWEQYLESYQTLGSTAPSGKGSSEELPSFENTLTKATTLFDHLTWQLKMSRCEGLEERVGTMIIGTLTDDGYFKIDGFQGDPLIRVAQDAECPIQLAEKVLRRIQHFDPVGVAARDLQECLLIQARHLGSEEGLVGAIIKGHMKHLEAKNLPAIAKELHLPLEEIISAVKVISQMEPKPGRIYSGEEPQYIVPDVHVHKVGDKYMTVLNDDGLSKLRISATYRNALKSSIANNGKAKDFIQDKLRSAVWLIRSIHQRQRTIYKVTESIVKFQRDFFDKGIAYLKPLILRDVAEDIGMHESTVSRVTTNKYVHTPQGIYELKFFFNSSIARTGGDEIASEAVKNHIKQIVAQEESKTPYSDQKIVEILRSQGIEIARRTVAKYREVLGILPSSKRKRYY